MDKITIKGTDYKCLRDGIYEVDEDIEVIEMSSDDYIDDDSLDMKLSNHYTKLDETRDIFDAFHKKYPDCVYAEGYETGCGFLLSRQPKKFRGNVIGSGFNYGSTNLLSGCPSRILIIAEND